MQARLEAPTREPLHVEETGGVSVHDVTHVYVTRRAHVVALEQLSLRVAREEIVAVVGPSGCGKSTLLELICGLQRPTAGAVVAEPAVYMPQRDLLLPWLSALDNAALALRVRGASARRSRIETSAHFARAGLAGFERALPHELSGGMRQRVAFLRTLMAGKPVLALDEPFAALDAITRQQMQAWLADLLVAEPRTVVLVTHDVEEAAVLADRLVLMSPRPGRVIAERAVAAPRPRVRTDPRIVALREWALEVMG